MAKTKNTHAFQSDIKHYDKSEISYDIFTCMAARLKKNL